MLIGCTLPVLGPLGPSPPGGGVKGSSGFCSSAMFFSQSKEQFSDTRQAIPPDHLGPVEMSAKCLHLQEVMCQKSTENYNIQNAFLLRANRQDCGHCYESKIA